MDCCGCCECCPDICRREYQKLNDTVHSSTKALCPCCAHFHQACCDPEIEFIDRVAAACCGLIKAPFVACWLAFQSVFQVANCVQVVCWTIVTVLILAIIALAVARSYAPGMLQQAAVEAIQNTLFNTTTLTSGGSG